MTDKQFYCTRCCQIVPPTEVGFASESGDRIHVNTSPHPNNDCEGTLVDASPAESSPAKFEALLVEQARESQASPLNSAPHIARQHIQALEALCFVVNNYVGGIGPRSLDDARIVERTAQFIREAKELLGNVDRLDADHQCPSCSISLIPSGLADASLLCPLCLRRFSQPSEPSTIPETLP